MAEARQAPLMVPESEASHCCPSPTASVLLRLGKKHGGNHGECGTEYKTTIKISNKLIQQGFFYSSFCKVEGLKCPALRVQIFARCFKDKNKRVFHKMIVGVCKCFLRLSLLFVTYVVPPVFVVTLYVKVTCCYCSLHIMLPCPHFPWRCIIFPNQIQAQKKMSIAMSWIGKSCKCKAGIRGDWKKCHTMLLYRPFFHFILQIDLFDTHNKRGEHVKKECDAHVECL